MDLGQGPGAFDADPEGAQQLVDQAHEEAKELIAELRNVARGVHPAVLTDRGLDAALSALAARSPGAGATSRSTCPGARRRPSRRSPTSSSREALTNVAKHAGADPGLGRRSCERDGRLLVDGRATTAAAAPTSTGGTGLAGLRATGSAAVDGTLHA